MIAGWDGSGSVAGSAALSVVMTERARKPERCVFIAGAGVASLKRNSRM
jgi:hypothetical protein